MLALMTLSSVAALLFVYIFMPALWLSIMAVDESLDAHEAGLAVVASRKHIFTYLDVHLSQLSASIRKPIPRKWSSSQHGQINLASS